MIAARDRPHNGRVAGHLGEPGRQIDRCATLIGALEAVGCDRPSMSTAARLATSCIVAFLPERGRRASPANGTRDPHL